jgi:hypothetical protein
MEVADQDYGARLYSCLDPEGHLWNFGTYDPADRQSLDDLATRRLDVVGAEIAGPRDQQVAHIGVDCAGVH